MQEIKFVPNTHLKEKPKDQSRLGFGKIFTDYMFTMEYNSKEGWHNAQVRPYENLSFDPATTFIHYGQAFFEGMKAYNAVDGVRLFRPMDNFARATRSAERLSMPALDEELAMAGLKRLLEADQGLDPHRPRHLALHPPHDGGNGRIPGRARLGQLPVLHHTLARLAPTTPRA